MTSSPAWSTQQIPAQLRLQGDCLKKIISKFVFWKTPQRSLMGFLTVFLYPLLDLKNFHSHIVDPLFSSRSVLRRTTEISQSIVYYLSYFLFETDIKRYFCWPKKFIISFNCPSLTRIYPCRIVVSDWLLGCEGDITVLIAKFIWIMWLTALLSPTTYVYPFGVVHSNQRGCPSLIKGRPFLSQAYTKSCVFLCWNPKSALKFQMASKINIVY